MKRILLITFTALWIFLIFYNSLKPAVDSAKDSSIIVNIIDNILEKVNIKIEKQQLSFLVRKAAHMFEFFVLFILVYYLINNFNCEIFTSYLLSLGCALFIAFVDEGIQYFVEGRASSIVDVGVDFLGALVGWLLLFIINLKKWKSTLNN